MRKEEGVRTGNSDEKRGINQNKTRGTEFGFRPRGAMVKIIASGKYVSSVISK